MTLLARTGLAIAALATAGLGAAASSASVSGLAHASDPEPIVCEFRLTKSGGSITLQGIINAQITVDGNYRLTLSGGANGSNTHIAQGSGFRSAPGKPTELGTIMLPASGIYTVSMVIDADGKHYACEEQIGGRI